MNEKKDSVRVLAPQYVKKFMCIADKCKDSCCTGWKVDIDKKTYKKYRNLQRNELSDKLHKYVTRNRSSNNSDSNYAKIKLVDGKCPFLNEKSLCNIQSELGAECLSCVCKTYPRLINNVDGIIEKSLSVSCPEAARLMLLEESKMEFDEYFEDGEVRVNQSVFNTQSNKLNKHFWNLRIFIISLLQNRLYTIEYRMIILGIFCGTVQKAIDEHKTDDIPGIIENYQGYVENNVFSQMIDEVPANYMVQFRLIKEIIDKKIVMGVTSEKFINYFKELLISLNCESGVTVEEVINNYKNAIKSYYEPFMNKNSYIIENYLVNYVFVKLFPLNEGKNVFDDYMMLVINYSFIKMMLLGRALYNEKITIDMAVDLIQIFSKTVEHNDKFILHIKKLMIDNKFNTMPYMSILLKN